MGACDTSTPMNLIVIYAKTQKGLEEMATRAYHVAQRFRQVLLLIDGKTSVAQLTSRFENAVLVEEALDFLSSQQFITAAGGPQAASPPAVAGHGAERLLAGKHVSQVLTSQLSAHLGPLAALLVADHVAGDHILLHRSEAMQIAHTLAGEIDSAEQRQEFLDLISKAL
jgi:hypothetical protein